MSERPFSQLKKQCRSVAIRGRVVVGCKLPKDHRGFHIPERGWR